MRRPMTTLGLMAVAALAGWAGQETRAPEGRRGPPDIGAMLMKGLKDNPGVLGVENASTASGKTSIFAWFKDKEAALDWYWSDTHMGMIDGLTTGGERVHEEPMMYLDDDQGPILCIATITPSDKPALEGVAMPIKQISIELYQPLPGGVAVGGKFAPEKLKVPHLVEIDLEQGYKAKEAPDGAGGEEKSDGGEPVEAGSASVADRH